jgi:hypothetical protein
MTGIGEPVPFVTPGGRDFSHGELLRGSNDQTLTINACRLQC